MGDAYKPGYRMDATEADRVAAKLTEHGYISVEVVERANGGYATRAMTPPRATPSGTWAPRPVMFWSEDEFEAAHPCGGAFGPDDELPDEDDDEPS